MRRPRCQTNRPWDVSTRWEVGGCCYKRSGRGRPAVVILPGDGAVGLDYLNVQERAAKLNEIYDEMRRAGPIPDVPLIVLTAMGVDAFKRAVLIGESDELLRQENEGKRRLYEALAGSVPRGENRVIEGAGHA